MSNLNDQPMNTYSESGNISDNSDSEGFQQPRKYASRENVRQSQQVPINTENRFGVLKNVSDSQQTENTNKTISNAKPPPITIISKLEFNKFHNDLKELVGNKYRLRYQTNNINIYPFDNETHKILIEAFKNSEIECFTFTPKSERVHKVVMKAAPHFNSEDILTNLQQNNMNINDCKKLISKRTGQSSSFLITTSDETELKRLKQIEDIDNVKLEWQNYARQSLITQCHRCQKYGHGSSNCTIAPRCLKCAENHLTRECKMPPRCQENMAKLRCSNCSGNHPANYSQCPIRLQHIQKLKVSANKTHVPQTEYNINQDRFPNLPRANDMPIYNHHSYINNTQSTFASAVKSNPTNLQSTNDISVLMHEVNDLNKICNITELITIIRELKAGLTNCHSSLDKIQFLSQLATKYNF